MLLQIFLKLSANAAFLFAMIGRGAASLVNSFQPTLPPEWMDEE